MIAAALSRLTSDGIQNFWFGALWNIDFQLRKKQENISHYNCRMPCKMQEIVTKTRKEKNLYFRTRASWPEQKKIGLQPTSDLKLTRNKGKLLWPQSLHHSSPTLKFEYHSYSRKFSVDCLKNIDSHVDLPWQSLWFSFSFFESLMLGPNCTCSISTEYFCCENCTWQCWS